MWPVALILLGCVCLPSGTAQTLPLLSPGARYDPSIPNLKIVVGHDFGEELTSPVQIEVYLEALAKAAPNRTRLVQYATSWEGRPLYMLVISSPERMSSLDDVKAGLQQLADPRTLPTGQVERLFTELPVVIALLHSAHGDELSSSGAALAEAYHLLAAKGDAVVEEILAESIVIIDPVQNPDGRARFIFQNLLARAAVPDATPQAAEHDETWPSGRVNHYLFDINRDWFTQTQPETRGKVQFLLDWYPHVTVDLHEMGGDPRVAPRSTYYFPPPTSPHNPYTTGEQKALLELFGRANAAQFDESGFPYFTREVFSTFFPGYASSWPLFYGAIPLMYEKASAHGLAFRRRDGSLLTYGDGVNEHFTAVLTTVKTAAQHRERILREFVGFRRAAMELGGTSSPHTYLLPPGADPGQTHRLVETLLRNGIEVGLSEAPIALAGRTFPEGTYVVSLAQPAGRLARNLLDPVIPMDDDFVREQTERLKRELPHLIYDLTAWSFPLLYDVDCVASERPIGGSVGPLTLASLSAPRSASLPAAKVAYLLPWGSSTAALVAEATRQGVRVHVANEPFTLGGRTFGVGTAVIRTSEHDDGLKTKLETLANQHRAEVVATDTGYVEGGISLGSNQVRPLFAPRVLLAWDSPTDSYSAGHTRFVLERRFGQPVTIVRVGSLSTVDFSDYDVFILPEGNYTPAIGADLLQQLKYWMERGGTLITLGEASRWASRQEVGLLGSELPPAQSAEGESPTFRIPGALLRVKLNSEHWLSAGTDGEIQALVNSKRTFAPLPRGVGRNVGLYESEHRLVAAGVVWDESKIQWAETAFLMIQPRGRGQLVAFAEDPNFRAYTEATELVFMNAVLLGPVHLPLPGVE